MMNHEINRLINFGLQKQLISKADIDYSVNKLLEILQIDEFIYEDINEICSTCDTILEKLLDKAVASNIIENNITQRDLFDTKIMDCLMPKPSSIINTFNELYQQSPQDATNYFYDLSIASNYIRKSRTDKNIKWKNFVKYGKIEISINLSKPEKDPHEIAMAKLVKSNDYPKCLLCKENVGFKGDLNRPSRQNHRVVPVLLGDTKYYLQYSPYVYYDEHCIIFNENHIPMVINEKTFNNLLLFLDKFPHYMIGSNADLPIVGGSILTHDHYQGGCYTFPIEGAQVLKSISCLKYPSTKIEVIKWPLSTIRITSEKKEELLTLANLILLQWQQYSLPSLDISAFSEAGPHNTITPIARVSQGDYQLDLVLRNNKTSKQYPDGIFHPHQELHHIKKENIGLIEVMGLAILPSRLVNELKLLKECLLGKAPINKYQELKKHVDWYNQLTTTYQFNEDNIDALIEEALTVKYVEVLEDAGVFKMDDEGINAFISFVETTIEKEG